MSSRPRLPAGFKAATARCSNSAVITAAAAVGMGAKPIPNSMSMRRLHIQSQHIKKGHPPLCTLIPHHRSKPIHKSTPYQHEHRRRTFTTTNPPTLRSFVTSPPQPPSIHPHSSSSDPTPLPEQFRSLMRLITHSVVVCTSSLGPVPRAMTMSSFTSLSLRPTPIISFNIATPSRTFDAVSSSRQFNIHILTNDPSGARIADWLARGNAAGLEVFEQLQQECGCSYEGGEKGEAPVIKGPGVLYVLRCQLLEKPLDGLVKVRDHYIVLGEVREIVEVNGNGGDKGEKFGLMYADRKYRELGGCIIPGDGVGEGSDGED
ncbi:flavin reductase like domain-containing protein [Triangularia setosa]|uniref:Flavin reductase like domain-containing protein n=1 Tax=Triangularia setosa TaxID=2587417 RepID=A0AAN6WHC7_9PEZI|nr:flavin reductase like domain-containing protein [Podospora setosa]